MRLFFENLPVAIIFLTVACFSWILGGVSTPDVLPVMPWIWAFTLETLLFFPQRHSGESLADARARVWKALSRDPITYEVLVLLVLLVMPIFNRGLCPVCDYPEILSGADPAPPIPYSPFCVNIREHIGVLMWFVPALTAMLAVRHALLRHGRRMIVHAMVWNGAALAVLGFIQQATGALAPFWLNIPDPVYFFSSFGYPNMAGAFFVSLFAVSAGLWQDNVREYLAKSRDGKKHSEEVESNPKEKYYPKWIKAHYMLIPMGLNFFASLATLSRAAILLSISIMGFWFLYLVLSLFTHSRNIKRVRLHIWMIVGVIATATLVSVFAPENFGKEISTLSPTAVADRVTGKAQYHTRVATAIFNDHPLFGVGGWGYKHFCLQYMTADDRKVLQVFGGVNVHNDYLQFLCEHGLVGALLLAAIVLMLLIPLFGHWGRMVKVAHFTKNDDMARPAALFCVPAVVVGVLLATVANLVHAFGDCIFRSPAVLTQFFVLLAAVPGFFHEDTEQRG